MWHLDFQVRWSGRWSWVVTTCSWLKRNCPADSFTEPHSTHTHTLHHPCFLCHMGHFQVFSLVHVRMYTFLLPATELRPPCPYDELFTRLLFPTASLSVSPLSFHQSHVLHTLTFSCPLQFECRLLCPHDECVTLTQVTLQPHPYLYHHYDSLHHDTMMFWLRP